MLQIVEKGTHTNKQAVEANKMRNYEWVNTYYVVSKIPSKN